MKISVSTYSFGKYNDEDKLGIFGIIDKAAEMGFDGIEFDAGPWIKGFDLEVAKKVGEYAREKGLETVGLCVGLDLVNGVFENEIKAMDKVIDFARALGVKKIRHDVAGRAPDGKKVGIGYDDVVFKCAEGCRRITEKAKEFGIETMTENHGYYSQDSERIEKLINATGDENFGALIDIGNFMCVDEDTGKAVGRLLPYVKHVHVKDFHFKSGKEIYPGERWFMTRGGNYLRGAIIGHGDANVYRCIKLLKNKGYDGYLSIEFEGVEDNLVGIKMGLDNLRRFVV